MTYQTVRRDVLGRFARIERCRRRDNYRKARKALIVKMGAKCHYCPRVKRLEFHHKEKRTWICESTSRWVRLARYRREWKEGKVVLACRKCNASKAPDYQDEVPF